MFESVSSSLALLILIPLLGSLLCGIISLIKRYSFLSGIIATAAVFFSFVLTVVIGSALEVGTALESELLPWIQLEGISIPFSLRFDGLTYIMCLLVTGVGSLIHLYSIGYMHHDAGIARFFSYLNLFIASMLTLILAANIPTLFIGWEGVGVCSALLISFWYTNAEYVAAGKKAFIVNRIGDVGLILAMVLLYNEYGTVDFAALGSVTTPGMFLDVVLLLLLLGAAGKSAQLPLSVWLPDAMAGPTPVSALIHAATMVTAGVYLLARCEPMLAASALVSSAVVIVGLLTALYGACAAFGQVDIKKVLAYSTVSQLGLMFVACGAGASSIAIYHVVSHGIFKALLFLSAGAVIHGAHHEQDMRNLGGLSKFMPITAWCFAFGAASLAAVYPTVGYGSKHAVLTALAGWSQPLSLFAIIISILTALYISRTFLVTFTGEYRGEEQPHEVSLVMSLPLIVLAIGCIAGTFMLPHFLLTNLTGSLMSSSLLHHSEAPLSSLMHSWTGILGLLGAVFLFGATLSGVSRFARFAQVGFGLDRLYALCIIAPRQALERVLSSAVDEPLRVSVFQGTAGVVTMSGMFMQLIQGRTMRSIAVAMLLGMVVLTVVMVVR